MRRRAPGMTLIEVLMAITILSMVMSMVYGAFTQTARNKQVLEEEADQYHTVRIALERMQRELSMAFVSIQTNPSPSLQVVRTAFVGKDRGHRDRIDFTSFSHQRLYRDAHESDQNELSYFITRHPDFPDVNVLARREQARIDDRPQEGGRVEIVLEDVKEFDLEYLDPTTNEWSRTWNSTQPADQPNRLPSQVKIRIVIPDPRRPSRDRVFGTRASIANTWALNHAVYNP